MALKKTKKFSVVPATPPNSEINVTPLVDVVLVLLIIFMVVTPLLEKDIAVRIPEVDDSATEVQMDTENTQLVVTLTEAGELSINNEKVTGEEYVESLKRKLNAKAKADRLVFFTADEKTGYAKLVTAIDGAKKAGAEIIGMMTDPVAAAPGAAAPGAPAAPPAP